MSGPVPLPVQTSAPPQCGCCGSTSFALRGRKRGTFLPREFDFYVCRDCGFMSVQPFSGFEIYDDAYYRGEGADPFVDYEAEYHNWRDSDRVLEFDDLARIASAHLSFRSPAPDATGSGPARQQSAAASSVSPDSEHAAAGSAVSWLDFGCGAGAFLKYLRSAGSLAGHRLELTGHDVGSYADLLKTKDGFRILDLAALQAEPSARYDVISLIEVIEHLPSPLEPLQLIARLLKPGGLLLLTTGNLESPVARREGIRYRYCAPEIHVSLFNPRSLTRLYERVGLVPHLVRYDGVVRFKVLKSLRHRRVSRALASAGLRLPFFARAVDRLYGVSAMPCAVKRGAAEGRKEKRESASA